MVSDSEKAAEYIELLQQRLWSRNDHSQDDDLTSIICMLESPMFKQLLTIQESLQELKHVSRSQPLTVDAFDITQNGELILNESSEGFSPESIADSSTLKLRGRPFTNAAPPSSSYSFDPTLESAIEKMAAGRPVHVIQLKKAENTSLGFSVVGIKNEERSGELGIFVRDMQPGGLAAQDGRLLEGDQLLAINGQPLEVSHHEAIRILQSIKGTAEIIVARGPPIISRTELPVEKEEAATASASPDTTGADVDAEEPAEEGEEEEEDKYSLDKSDMVLSTDWTQLEVIDLINDGTGLGFGIIGGRSTGVVVKTILPGGIADQDGHLRSGDHILQIGDVNVRGMSSEQVALVLRQSGSHVRLVVARSVHEAPQFQIPQAPIIPTHQLEEHMEHFNAVMAMEAGEHEQHLHNLHLQHQLQQYQLHQQQLLLGSVQVHPQPLEVMQEVPDVDVFEVDLMKDSHGLGITIAGYVGGDNTPDEISGIFVKSITEGSAAAIDGRVHVNDQIIEVSYV
ncbi:hypothetical protein BsWGS_02447 [Bradybaena similaris]